MILHISWILTAKVSYFDRSSASLKVVIGTFTFSLKLRCVLVCFSSPALITRHKSWHITRLSCINSSFIMVLHSLPRRIYFIKLYNRMFLSVDRFKLKHRNHVSLFRCFCLSFNCCKPYAITHCEVQLSYTHSLDGSLCPPESRRCDHWPCPKQHLQKV